MELKGKVLAGKILVLPMLSEDKTVGGIIIPESAKEKPNTGEVVLVGLPKKDETMEVSVGDVVYYGQHTGIMLLIDNIDYLLMDQTSVLYIK